MFLSTVVSGGDCATLYSMRIGFVGGGTGGHFYPLIAVAEELIDNPEKPELYYFGPSPFDQDRLDELGISYVYCPAGKIRRYFSIQNILDMFRIFGGIFVAIVKLYIIYPDVIFSKGGYTSVPILMAARFLRIPVVIHESDAKPGRANKYAKKFAQYVAITWPTSAEYFPEDRTALTGIPIRRGILKPNPHPHEALGIPDDLPLLYVTGGSLGAERINTLIINSLQELLPHVRIFHQTGPDHEVTVKKTARELLVNNPELLERYYVIGRTDATTVSNLLGAAKLVITRAGSTTLFEIALYGKPAIVIPIPEEVSHDQRTNAYAYARNGAASVLEEENLTQHLLQAEIFSILGDTDRYQSMQEATNNIARIEAASTIASVLISIGHEHGS